MPFLKQKGGRSALLQPGFWEMLRLLSPSCYFHICMHVYTIKGNSGQSRWRSASTPASCTGGVCKGSLNHSPPRMPEHLLNYPGRCNVCIGDTKLCLLWLQRREERCLQGGANLRHSWGSSWYDFQSSWMIKPLFLLSSVTQLFSAFLSLTLCGWASFDLEYSHFSSYCVSRDSFIPHRSVLSHIICRGLYL